VRFLFLIAVKGPARSRGALETERNKDEVTMAQRKTIEAFPTCPHCGSVAHSAEARFCGRCGTSLIDARPRLSASAREHDDALTVARAPKGRHGFLAAAVILLVWLIVGLAVLALIGHAAGH
jgi:hypothetical protein